MSVLHAGRELEVGDTNIVVTAVQENHTIVSILVDVSQGCYSRAEAPKGVRSSQCDRFGEEGCSNQHIVGPGDTSCSFNATKDKRACVQSDVDMYYLPISIQITRPRRFNHEPINQDFPAPSSLRIPSNSQSSSPRRAATPLASPQNRVSVTRRSSPDRSPWCRHPAGENVASVERCCGDPMKEPRCPPLQSPAGADPPAESYRHTEEKKLEKYSHLFQAPLRFITGKRGSSSSTLDYPPFSSLQSPNTHFLFHCERERGHRERQLEVKKDSENAMNLIYRTVRRKKKTSGGKPRHNDRCF
ncbi:hypothetical protein EYF80_017320 [Liparis tanakae]|uniref:Uncharacterized protein n=1 Tax=Liparis tanakae TaxID=230148 RepID=A0A4Z2I518_9TELE|nr:hypothetical protein EYF80_017320 [Liparis tanakae]